MRHWAPNSLELPDNLQYRCFSGMSANSRILGGSTVTSIDPLSLKYNNLGIEDNTLNILVNKLFLQL